jgi:DNA-binding MarR family transcriptional regulator
MEESDKRDFQALLWALKPLINLSGFMPLPFVTTFLFVALDEGKGVNTYARAIGIHRSLMSKNLHALGDRARNGGPGLGLVTVDPHPTASGRSQVYLTAKGRLVVKEVLQQLRRSHASWLQRSPNHDNRQDRRA